MLHTLYFKQLSREYDLNFGEIAVLLALMLHYNSDTGKLFPAQETMANNLNSNRSSINRIISRLIRKRIIQKEKDSHITSKGKCNRYSFSKKFIDRLEILAKGHFWNIPIEPDYEQIIPCQ